MRTIANAVVANKSLDAQFSQNNGVLLQVSGVLKLQVGPRRVRRLAWLLQTNPQQPQQQSTFIICACLPCRAWTASSCRPFSWRSRRRVTSC
jgi:hypothetical protein